MINLIIFLYLIIPIAYALVKSSLSYSSIIPRINNPHKIFSMGNFEFQPNPIKAMVFIDGTWLYYSLLQGHNNVLESGLLAQKFGNDWDQYYEVDWNKLPQFISRNLALQLKVNSGITRGVEIARTYAFTSLKPETIIGGLREKMLSGFYGANYDVHRFETKNSQEKCVDISLAVEMLYMATVPNAYDIAVILTGDKDFIPALQKTRLLAKKVAICTIRNSYNRDFIKAESGLRDFNVIWINDFLDELVHPKSITDVLDKENIEKRLLDIIIKEIVESEQEYYSSRDLGRFLLAYQFSPQKNALTILKEAYSSLSAFLEKFSHLFEFSYVENDQSGFLIKLSDRFKGISQEESGNISIDNLMNAPDMNQKSFALPEEFSKEQVAEKLCELIREYFESRHLREVNSRVLGRYLQSIKVNDINQKNALYILKQHFGSLKELISEHLSNFFVISKPAANMTNKVIEFNIHLRDHAQNSGQSISLESNEISTSSNPKVSSSLPTDYNQKKLNPQDFSNYSVKQLKSLLSSKGMPVYGTKSILIQRLSCGNLERKTPK